MLSKEERVVSSKLTFDGMAEFRAELSKLPEHLALLAADIVAETAETVGQQTSANYPVRRTGLHPSKRRKGTWFPPGNLKARVRVEIKDKSRLGVRAMVRSQAPHSGIFESGTEQRQTRTGANRGRMPKAQGEQAMIPRVQRARRRMVERLKAMVRGEGLTVE